MDILNLIEKSELDRKITFLKSILKEHSINHKRSTDIRLNNSDPLGGQKTPMVELNRCLLAIGET
jgi:hypothetical protein